VYHKDLQYKSFVQTFRTYGFPKLPTGLSADRLIELMKKDKKANSGVIRMVLMKEIGEVEVVPVSDELIASTLEEFMDREWSL
jgi:3-dehydroquinate synthase